MTDKRMDAALDKIGELLKDNKEMTAKLQALMALALESDQIDSATVLSVLEGETVRRGRKEAA